jgi:hypothetical protein
MKIFNKKLYIPIAMLVCLLPATSFAASVFFDVQKQVEVGSTFEITINADTDEELVNSIKFVLDYDETLLSFSGYKSNAGVVGLWIRSPYEKQGQIHMEGIIPGGVSGLYDPNEEHIGAVPIVTLIFKSLRPGVGSFNFIQSEILKHDGKGSTLDHRRGESSITVKEKPKTDESIEPVEDIIDAEEPEPFMVTFIGPSTSSDTPPLIVFNALDAGSGIKEYQVKVDGTNWVNAASPFVVAQGLFPYSITVRAYDFYGNFKDSIVTIPGMVSAPTLTLIILALFVFCIIVYRVVKYKV